MKTALWQHAQAQRDARERNVLRMLLARELPASIIQKLNISTVRSIERDALIVRLFPRPDYYVEYEARPMERLPNTTLEEWLQPPETVVGVLLLQA